MRKLLNEVKSGVEEKNKKANEKDNDMSKTKKQKNVKKTDEK